MLDVIARCVILLVLPFEMLLLEGCNGQHGRSMCIIVYCVIFVMWMAKLANLWLLFLVAYGVCCANNI
jgi:hypothetical protein